MGFLIDSFFCRAVVMPSRKDCDHQSCRGLRYKYIFNESAMVNLFKLARVGLPHQRRGRSWNRKDRIAFIKKVEKFNIFPPQDLNRRVCIPNTILRTEQSLFTKKPRCHGCECSLQLFFCEHTHNNIRVIRPLSNTTHLSIDYHDFKRKPEFNAGEFQYGRQKSRIAKLQACR